MKMESSYKIEEVANALQVNHSTIRRLISNGELGHYRIGKIYKISERQLHDYLKSAECIPVSILESALSIIEQACDSSSDPEEHVENLELYSLLSEFIDKSNLP